MSYLQNQPVEKVDLELFHSKMSFSNPVQAGSYMTIETPLINQISLTQNTDNLVLGAGFYQVQACIGVDNSDSLTNSINSMIELDGTTFGNISSSAQSTKVGIDAGYHNFKINHGQTKTLKIKVTALSGSVSVVTNHSYLLVKRVNL